MAITFRLDKHRTAGYEIVEVLLNGDVVGVIYPDRDLIRVVSAHFKSAEADDHMPEPKLDDGRGRPLMPPIPAVEIGFKFRNYNIVRGELVFIKGGVG